MKVGEVKMKRKVNVIEDLDGKKTVFIHDILFKGKRAVKWDEVEKYLRQYVGDICSIDVGMIISQLEIYDQIWFVRHAPKKGEHSREAIELVTEIIARLEGIPDGCAECFPFELIDEFKQEYLTDNS